MRISDWSSDVCSSDLIQPALHRDEAQRVDHMRLGDRDNAECRLLRAQAQWLRNGLAHHFTCKADIEATPPAQEVARIEAARQPRSEERRVGDECVSTCRSRWSPDLYKKKTNNKKRD